MGIYNSSKFMGPCWSRSRGYHHPTPLAPHIMRILTGPRPSPVEDAKTLAAELPPAESPPIGSEAEGDEGNPATDDQQTDPSTLAREAGE